MSGKWPARNLIQRPPPLAQASRTPANRAARCRAGNRTGNCLILLCPWPKRPAHQPTARPDGVPRIAPEFGPASKAIGLCVVHTGSPRGPMARLKSHRNLPHTPLPLAQAPRTPANRAGRWRAGTAVGSDPTAHTLAQASRITTDRAARWRAGTTPQSDLASKAICLCVVHNRLTAQPDGAPEPHLNLAQRPRPLAYALCLPLTAQPAVGREIAPEFDPTSNALGPSVPHTGQPRGPMAR